MNELTNTISSNTKPTAFVLCKRRLATVLGGAMLLSGALAWFGNTWIGGPAGFLFGVWLPGMLLYLLIKRHFSFSWMISLLTVGLGIASLIFVTLAHNWLLQAIGIAAPLQREYIFGAVSLFAILLFIAGYGRWQTDAFTFVRPRFNWLDRATLASGALLPLASIVGAVQLNNGGSGAVATACFLAIPALVIWLVAMRKRLATTTIVWALWFIGLAVLLSGWLRSNYLAGPDVGKEYLIFQLAKGNGVWDIDAYRDAYNACLSISLLPTSLSFLTSIPDMLTFKLLFPAIYSLIIPAAFLIAKERIKTAGAILAVAFLFSQPPFTIWWWIPLRQQIALFFFALLLLVIVKMKRDRSALILFILLAAAMIVSHYSTTYIAIGLITVLVLMHAVLRQLRKPPRLPALLVSPTIVLVMLMTTFVWYSQITYGFDNIGQFVAKSVQNMGSMFSDDTQQAGQSALDRFNIFSKPGVTTANAVDYAQVQQKHAQKTMDSGQLYTTGTVVQLPKYKPPSSTLATIFDFGRSVFKVGGNLLVSIGIVIVTIVLWRQRRASTLSLLQISAMAIMVAIMLLPFFSVSYGPDRMYLQLLLVLAPAALMIVEVSRRSRMWVQRAVLGACTIFVVLYFLLLNQVLMQFTNTPLRNINFSNSGTQYITYRIARGDVEASKWLMRDQERSVPIYGDSFAFYRMSADTNLEFIKQQRTGVLISGLPKKSYVYQAASNTATQTGFDLYASGMISYEFPSSFLNKNKNTVYSGGDTVIYR